MDLIMDSEINRLILEMPTWLNAHYLIEATECKIIVPGVNLVFSALTASETTYYIKVFNRERSWASLNLEAKLCNDLKSHAISAAAVLKSRSNDFVTVMTVQDQQHLVLVFEQAPGTQSTYLERDIQSAAYTLAQLHQLPISHLLPCYDHQAKHAEIQKLLELDCGDVALQKHYLKLINLVKTQNFHHEMVLCHGDPRPRNIFIEHNVSKFIDFEYACISSPCMDVAIMLWNLQRWDKDSTNLTTSAAVFLNAYSQYSNRVFTLEEIAPDLLLHEIKKIAFLVQHGYLTPYIIPKILKDSAQVIKWLSIYLSNGVNSNV